MTRSIVLLLVISLASCGGTPGTPDSGADTGTGDPFRLTSSAFVDGGSIPIAHVCQPAGAYGTGDSPPLDWSSVPMGTLSYALIMDDPDASDWSHWVVYDIPVTTRTSLRDATPAGGTLGVEQNGMAQYAGPCPPSGIHTYSVRVYALDLASIGLPAGATRAEVLAAIEGHVLGIAELRGRVDAGIL